MVASAAPYLGNESWGQSKRPAEGGKERGGTVTKSQTREEHADAQPEAPADARRGAGGSLSPRRRAVRAPRAPARGSPRAPCCAAHLIRNTEPVFEFSVRQTVDDSSSVLLTSPSDLWEKRRFCALTTDTVTSPPPHSAEPEAPEEPGPAWAPRAADPFWPVPGTPQRMALRLCEDLRAGVGPASRWQCAGGGRGRGSPFCFSYSRLTAPRPAPGGDAWDGPAPPARRATAVRGGGVARVARVAARREDSAVPCQKRHQADTPAARFSLGRNLRLFDKLILNSSNKKAGFNTEGQLV